MGFQFAQGPFEGMVLVQPEVRNDHRGSFWESFKASVFAEAGIEGPFVQENQSQSHRGVLRGIHYQTGPWAQGKLIRVLQGSIWDLAVDLRSGSPTYGRWAGVELSAESRTMMYLPPGLGHGFLALSYQAEVLYLCTREYRAESEGGVRWNDPTLAIEWPVVPGGFVVSEKDGALPFLTEALK